MSDIKSNNPHLTGGEQMPFPDQSFLENFGSVLSPTGMEEKVIKTIRRPLRWACWMKLTNLSWALRRWSVWGVGMAHWIRLDVAGYIDMFR